MPARTLTAALTFGLLALAAPVAQADGLQDAHQAAVGYWGGEPPCGTPTIEMTANLRRDVEVDGLSFKSECRIQIDADFVADDSSFPDLCVKLAHEYGHLWMTGSSADHSPDPNNVMYPYSHRGTTPQCAVATEALLSTYLVKQDKLLGRLDRFDSRAEALRDRCGDLRRAARRHPYRRRAYRALWRGCSARAAGLRLRRRSVQAQFDAVAATIESLG